MIGIPEIEVIEMSVPASGTDAGTFLAQVETDVNEPVEWPYPSTWPVVAGS